MEIFEEELISGAGGGKGGTSTPQNAKDNLNSTATAKILDVISEGEIAGFATPLEKGFSFGTTNYDVEGQKDIFLNRTPLRRLNAPTDQLGATQYNFNKDDLVIETKNGTDPQSVIQGFSKVRSVLSAFPSDDLTNKGDSRTLSFSDTDAARISQVVVIVGIPALFATYNNGDVKGSSLRYKIELSVDGGGNFTEIKKIKVKGRTNDLYQRQKTINIPDAPDSNARNLAIKVTKVNDLHDDKKIITQGNSVRFMSIVKVIDDKLSYDNTALIGLQVDAENFSSIPKRTYLVKGIKIRIPGAGANNSGTPNVDINTGRIVYPTNYVFNGTMQVAQFCACPVFVLYDILTNSRYGFGDQVLTPAEKASGGFSSGNAKNIDLFSFVEASKYANTLVSDRRLNPTSITGTYSQSDTTTITITFTVSSQLQSGDVVTCDFTSGNAADLTNVKITKVTQNKTVIEVQGSNEITTSGNVTVTKGNTEPRFSFNGVINRQEDAFKLLNKVAAVFRGAVYYSEGKIKLTCDKPADPVYLFNRSNVTAEGFSYEGTDVKTRSNCVIVRFFNNISQQIDYVQHPLASSLSTDPFVKNYGLTKRQVDAFGCTSAGQASRLARFIYYAENFLTETCSFVTASDAGVMLTPGMVISISDPVRSGTRVAGRITAVSANRTQITVDSITGISYASGDKLSVILGNGTMETKDVNGISGNVVTVSSAFSSAININSVWLYEKTTVEPTTWRVLSIQQGENLEYAVTGITYNSSLYNTIEGGTDVEAKDITQLDEKVDAPSTLTVNESLYKHVPNSNDFATNDANIRVQLRISWPSVDGAVKYKVVYTVGTNPTANSSFPILNDESDPDLQTNPTQDNPIDVIVRRNELELRNVEAGRIYAFEVQSINAAGLLSASPTTASHLVVGKSTPPSDVANLSATIDPNDGVGLNWLPVVATAPNFADLDLAGYEIRKGTVWNNGTHPETGKQIEQTGTYTQSGTTITVTISDHGFAASNQITLNFTSGKAINSTFSITSVTNTNTFVVTASNGTDPLTENTISYSGNVTAIRESIRVQATNLLIPIEFIKASSTFMVKAYDTSGNFSTNAASTALTINPPSAIVSPVTTAENGIIKIRWDAPTTHTYKIKNYKITFTDVGDSIKTIFVDSTEFQTPGAWVGSNRVFTISAVDITGNEGTSTDVTVTIPEPSAPTNLTHSFTTDSVVLKWTEAASSGALQPPVIGYRIYRNNNFTSSIAQIKGTEFTLLVNSTNFPNVSGTAQASYQVAAVYADPAFPVDGKPTANKVTTTISIGVAPAPTASFSFELDFVKITWNEVNGDLPTIRYGIFTQNGGTQIGVVDGREFILKSNFDVKELQIKAFSAAYIKAAGDVSSRDLFIGAGSSFNVTRSNLGTPTNGSFVLGNEGGLGFVTTKWTTPAVNSANNLDFKDFKIIRSSSSTFAGVTTGNTELSVIQDTESFKEEVSWTVTGQNDSITKYYYIIPRDLLKNEGTALKIEVEIFRPDLVPASGTCEVIDNNVLLRWGEPVVNPTNQLKIDHYEIRKHTGGGLVSQVWSTSSPIGKGSGETITNSRFSVIFETVANTYTYLIKAYDTAGNPTKDSRIFFKSLVVSQPPDFVLNADYDSVFSTSGTGLSSPQEIDSVAFTNCLKVFDIALNKNVLYLPVLTNSSGAGTQTWSQHFIGTGSSSSPQFASISAIQSAGFSDYLEPAPTGDSGKGEYQEVFDYGTNLASSKVSTLAEFANQGSGTVNQSQRLDLVSGGSGGTFSNGTESNSNSAQRFGVGFQRVRYKTRAISVAGSLTKITNLNMVIDVKIKNDTGTGTASASDSGGTQVNFNVTFVDVQGIAVTPNTTSAVIAVVDFQDAPNPTSFKVLLYNTSGVRVSGNFTWQCRGT